MNQCLAEKILVLISYVKNIFVDGTFSLALTQFAQILMIMADSEDFIIFILYAFLLNKHQGIYV